MTAMARLGDWLYAKLSGFPREWMDPQWLADWQASHADPAGDVWCVTPLMGDGWELFVPGSIQNDSPYPYKDVGPAAASSIDTEDPDRVLWLADVEHWMRPWIEQVSGGRVVEMIEGVARYGPSNALSEYAIFARVER